MSEHGGNIYEASRLTGIPEERIVDFSASINPIGVPKGVARTIKKRISRLFHYPEPFAESLATRIGTAIDVPSESIICGNGSTELIYLIPRVLRPAVVLIPEPSFREYERACLISGAQKIAGQRLKAEKNFDLKADEFIRAMETVSAPGTCTMAFLCNPNNPTGRLVAKEDTLKIAQAAASLGCYLVVDEAFIDYCPEETVVASVRDNPYLIVLRSLTKFYALAGLRIGYAVVHGELADRFQASREPWTVNSLAQAAALEALGDEKYQKRSWEFMKQEKVFIEKALGKLTVKYYPSRANYYLLESDKAGMIRTALKEKGILVRDCSNFTGLDSRFLRIAVRTRRENRMLLKEMARICAPS